MAGGASPVQEDPRTTRLSRRQVNRLLALILVLGRSSTSTKRPENQGVFSRERRERAAQRLVGTPTFTVRVSPACSEPDWLTMVWFKAAMRSTISGWKRFRLYERW